VAHHKDKDVKGETVSKKVYMIIKIYDGDHKQKLRYLFLQCTKSSIVSLKELL